MSAVVMGQRPTFIDLFSGCGGLSLGLSQAGWRGLFAIERSSDAFDTFKANFIGEKARHPFSWPTWLELGPHSIDDVLANHAKDLASLRGKIDLIAGGPPCQGFSFAGKRHKNDPRNGMFERYVTFVDIIRPRMLVLENVPGMNVAHAGGEGTYFEKLIDALHVLGYKADGRVLDAAKFGVPQRRARIVVVGVRSKDTRRPLEVIDRIFQAAMDEGKRQLKDLSNGSFVSAQDAISDLIVGSGLSRLRKTVDYIDDSSRARGTFRQLRYTAPLTTYQRQMNKSVPATKMDSMRLANHSMAVEERFQKILSHCPRGVNINADNREWLGMLKHRTIPMNGREPSPTLTTLPDDVLHYKDPRILTVREYARIQSFPDWFKFRGKYTTGGQLRKLECPRYTQVGNAVPPLLGRAVGVALRKAFLANAKDDTCELLDVSAPNRQRLRA